MFDIFNTNAFSLTALTEAINHIPTRYGRVGELGLFREKPVRFRSVTVEEQNGTLCLLPTQIPGGPAYVNQNGKRTLRSFQIPHIPLEDLILPDEIQGIRAFGKEDEVTSISRVVADHLQTMKNKHSITLEYMRMSALKGNVTAGDGTLLYNLYTEFGITPKTVNFQLNVAGTNVLKKCLEVVRHIEDNLQGEYCTGVRALVSSEFFDALTSHASVKEAYERWQDGAALRTDMRTGFPFGGILFEEYRGHATDANGQDQRFIEEGAGHVFPTGTTETFVNYFAPADFNETVNTLGQPLYAKTENCRFDRGVELHVQSNPLPLCLRPAVLITLKAQ